MFLQVQGIKIALSVRMHKSKRMHSEGFYQNHSVTLLARITVKVNFLLICHLRLLTFRYDLFYKKL